MSGWAPVQSIIGFMRRMITITDGDMYQLIGMDALVYTRFYRWGLETFTFAFVVGILILLPTNYFGDNKQTGLDRLSLSNIERNAPALWAHFVVTHLVFVFATWRLHLLYNMVTPNVPIHPLQGVHFLYMCLLYDGVLVVCLRDQKPVD